MGGEGGGGWGVGGHRIKEQQRQKTYLRTCAFALSDLNIHWARLA